MDVGRSTEVCGLSGRVQGVNIVNEGKPEVGELESREKSADSGHTACQVDPTRY